jgi:hypothetical protein
MKTLTHLMIDMGILTVDDFEGWLNEEMQGLKAEPEAETLNGALSKTYHSESSPILLTPETRTLLWGSQNIHKTFHI